MVITLEDQGTQCRVSIAEDAVRGPGLAVPKAVRDPIISVRNRETLKRLELMAAGGAAASQTLKQRGVTLRPMIRSGTGAE